MTALPGCDKPQWGNHSGKRCSRMAVKDARSNIVLACTECKQRNYTTMKNKKNTPDRIEFNKFCRFCKKHTAHRETR